MIQYMYTPSQVLMASSASGDWVYWCTVGGASRTDCESSMQQSARHWFNRILVLVLVVVAKWSGKMCHRDFRQRRHVAILSPGNAIEGSVKCDVSHKDG